MLLGTFVCAFVLLAVFARGLPTMVKEVLVGQPLGNVNVFVNRDDHQYKQYFNRYFRKASTVDIIGIGNSQFSEQDWGGPSTMQSGKTTRWSGFCFWTRMALKFERVRLKRNWIPDG